MIPAFRDRNQVHPACILSSQALWQGTQQNVLSGTLKKKTTTQQQPKIDTSNAAREKGEGEDSFIFQMSLLRQ